ncbi:glutamine--tRNA ligase [Sphingopyxis sp. Root214]|uniref:glutamate--tRNA ligase n=1 Tax=unclassified Sphingopyxis TaxID=2614943 RepID=UPI0006F6CE7A|nr:MULTISPECIES: glutamate--tRNA ligase [unclassified Sphingopyxis]KQZ73983.1 glutamine--tRNA ligase [Sphingopyxis sp. Root154]KRC08123.1 glutamine--tRNA ligase [Sphingopyxis sp. Root214]
MTVVTRFAPSPTGTLHVGNVRTALHNWLWARKHGGRFLLRIDDTDLERSKEEYVDAIRADLAWLGFDIDGEERQSARFALYEAEFEKLKAAGRVYACYETPEELDIRRKILLSRGLPPVYERKPADAPIPEGIAPHWRFRLDHGQAIEWTDMVRGSQHFEPKTMSDPVVRRADGSWLYLLPSVIDDIAMGITHVVRGEDHVSNTASQVQMFAALGATPPAFAHEALLVGTEGKLSKRLGSLGMASVREAGIEPIALVALLARLGTSDPVEPVTDGAPLIESIDFARFGRAPARFDEAELALLNQKILHHTDHAAIADRLPAAITEARWNAIRPNVMTVAEAAEWVRVFDGPFAPPPAEAADRPVLDAAAQAAPAIDWGADPWHALTGAVKEATGAKGRALFLPLRRALTARDHGPDMAELLPLIDKDQAVARLSAI